jgi:hypothetical protein
VDLCSSLAGVYCAFVKFNCSLSCDCEYIVTDSFMLLCCFLQQSRVLHLNSQAVSEVGVSTLSRPLRASGYM